MFFCPALHRWHLSPLSSRRLSRQRRRVFFVFQNTNLLRQIKYRLHWQQDLIKLLDFKNSGFYFFNCCTSTSLYFQVLSHVCSTPPIFLPFFSYSIHIRLVVRMTSLGCSYVSCSSSLSSWMPSLVTPQCMCSNVCTFIISLSISSLLQMSSVFLFASGIEFGFICATNKKLWITLLASWVNTLPSNHTSKNVSHDSCSCRRQDTWWISDLLNILAK